MYIKLGSFSPKQTDASVLQRTSSSATAERPRDACLTSNRKPVKNCVC